MSTPYIVPVLEQLQDLGWDRIEDVDLDLHRISFRHGDGDYCFTLNIPREFPEQGPILAQCDFPNNEFKFDWIPGKSTLRSIFTEFGDQLTHFTPLWDRLADLDAQTWVLDPENPSGQDLYRRVVISPGISLQIELDPSCPLEFPLLRFLGPESQVQEFRSNLVNRLHLYDPERSLVYNLENILLLEFPSPSSDPEKSEEFNFECCICYDRKLGDALPSESCKGEHCKRVFHKECLLMYLETSPESNTNTIMISGKCPYCDTPISCEK